MSSVLPTREAWLRERARGIGASEVAAVLGCSPWLTPLRLFGLKCGVLDPADESERMKLGRRLEPLVADLYSEETGRALRDLGPYTVLRHPDVPILSATLDREIVATAERPVGVLELKTTGFQREDEWVEHPPLHVLIQAQAQLAVTGHTWASIAVLIAGQRFLWLDMVRNETFIALMLERVIAFWDCVQRVDPPPPAPTDLETLRVLYPADLGTTVSLPEQALVWDATWREARIEVAKWRAVMEDAEARIKGAMGAATYGLLPQGAGRYAWKQHTRHEPAREAREVDVRTFRRMTP
jgi:putative phage-type endonuclease